MARTRLRNAARCSAVLALAAAAVVPSAAAAAPGGDGSSKAGPLPPAKSTNHSDFVYQVRLIGFSFKESGDSMGAGHLTPTFGKKKLPNVQADDGEMVEVNGPAIRLPGAPEIDFQAGTLKVKLTAKEHDLFSDDDLKPIEGSAKLTGFGKSGSVRKTVSTAQGTLELQVTRRALKPNEIAPSLLKAAQGDRAIATGLWHQSQDAIDLVRSSFKNLSHAGNWAYYTSELEFARKEVSDGLKGMRDSIAALPADLPELSRLKAEYNKVVAKQAERAVTLEDDYTEVYETHRLLPDPEPHYLP